MPRYDDDDYDFDHPRKGARVDDERSTLNVRLWTLFAACAIIAFLLVGLVPSVAVALPVAVCFGVVLVVLAIILVFVVCGFEERRTPPKGTDALGIAAGVTGGMAGVILYFMLRHTARWPQPLLTLLLAVGTFVGSALLERPDRPAAETARATTPEAPEQRPARPQFQPPQPPLPQSPKEEPKPPAPKKDEPKKDEPKKDEPKRAEFPKADATKKQRPFDVDPNAKAAKQSLHLAYLTPFAFQNSPWTLGVGCSGDLGGTPIVLNKRTYQYALSMHPPKVENGMCQVSFVPGGEFKRFKGWAGVHDKGWEKPVVFAVYGDGKPLWESQPNSKPGTAVAFDIDVTGVQVLSLTTRMAQGEYTGAHAVWLDPWLER